MPLTVKDILEKTFKRSFKGYDEDEVDRFLDQIIDEFKQLQGDNEALRVALDAANERVERIADTETTIMNTLVSAQKSSERLLAEAARKAELIIDSAQTTARRRAEQTALELEEAEKRLEEIRGQAAQFAERFAHMINSQAASFDRAYRSYFGEPETAGGIAVDATKRIGADVEDGLKSIGVISEPSAQKPAETLEQPEASGAEAMPVPEVQPEFVAGVEEAPKAAEGFMSLQDINKALSELEEEDGVVLDENTAESDDRPRYDDYSWLYNGDTETKGPEISGKDDEELKSLIDEVIE